PDTVPTTGEGGTGILHSTRYASPLRRRPTTWVPVNGGSGGGANCRCEEREESLRTQTQGLFYRTRYRDSSLPGGSTGWCSRHSPEQKRPEQS
ncbi:hypothetical protein LTR35_018395, partial [Friedmanniomyces endolithicus]